MLCISWVINDIFPGLPTKERQKEGALQFLGASEKVEIMDVAKVIVNDMKDLQRWLIINFMIIQIVHWGFWSSQSSIKTWTLK